MPWSLIMSVIPFVAFVGLLVVHEFKSSKRLKAERDENRECIKPLAKIADNEHKKRFGRPSTELNEVFPDLKAVK